MTGRVEIEGWRVHEELHRFLVDEALPGTGVDAAAFLHGLCGLFERFADRNRELLARREDLQARIDDWHLERAGQPVDPAGYRRLLEDIGYLEKEGPDFEISTAGTDPEISTVAGPQLVVPVTNARYVLNAANARWGSLYDALYGTDAVVAEAPAPGGYDPERGARVIAWVRDFLDEVFPLAEGSHAKAASYRVEGGRLLVETAEGTTGGLLHPSALAGYRGEEGRPTSVLLRNHGLHVELVLDRSHPVGSSDPAGIADVVIEAATTAIVDFEDSVAVVDAGDKVAAYRTFLGLVRGDLEATFEKGGSTVTRRLAEDRAFTAPDGSSLVLPGRALLLVRNVGLSLFTEAVLDPAGRPVPEGLLDAMVTVLVALHDLRREAPRHLRHGSVYVVKPKLHGPEEVGFVDQVFAEVEAVLGLTPGTVKVGLMDEERRTTLNLKECIRAASSRLAFINTGFLDRTGDEIHTSLRAGALVRKAEMKRCPWFLAYEDHNVDVGLACGLAGRAQIGKGMWAAPEQMAQMLEEKIAQPLAGANCAWVPSPTAATLHATHYHRIDVAARQAELTGARRARLEDLLALPLGEKPPGPEEIQAELDNNAQGILGYAVRWVDQGIGCSKVPDIHDVALMEDRATCRISSQHIANWLLHGLVDRSQVLDTFRRMAAVVDRQNASDPAYSPMAPAFDGPAFRAALALVLEGADQPSGYTEPALHRHRLERKAQQR